MPSLVIKGGHLVDPSQGINGAYDLLIEDGRVKRIDREISPADACVIDARGAVVAPGFVDIHVHLRDPGETYKEDMLSGCRAAVAGGYTTLVCMPNTAPPVDNPVVVEYVRAKADSVGLCNVLPAGTLTVGRRGEQLSDFYALRRAGCVAFTDDGAPLKSSGLMRKALELCSQLGVPVMNHCEDPELSRGVVNEGRISALTGLPGRDPAAEDILIARDCILSYHTGGHLHVQHLTTALGADLIRFFKDRGAKVTCEVNPLHLLLTEEEVLKEGAAAKINPPLRSSEDVKALRSALVEKKTLEDALPGMTGLQTALPAMLSLVEEGIIDLYRMVELMATNPALIVGIEAGSLRIGYPADVVVFDPEAEWELNEETLKSKSRNTPLWGRKLRGRVLYTLRGGKVVFSIRNAEHSPCS